MRKLINIFLVAVAVVAGACSKERAPEVADNEFEIRMDDEGNEGHYLYTLELFKGALFSEPLMLEVEMNGAEGNLLINGKEYSEPMAVNAGEINVAYLPYSAGDHKIALNVKGGALNKSAEINIAGVTALPKNSIFVPFETSGFDVELGKEYKLFVKDDSYFKVNKERPYQLDWIAEGKGFVYTKINDVVTGAAVSADKYIELEGLIVEVNGVICNSAKGITEVKSNVNNDGICNSDDYERVKIIGLYPENATCQTPRLTGKWYMPEMPFFPVEMARYKDVVNIEYVTGDFWGKMPIEGDYGVVITLLAPNFNLNKDIYICKFID